MAKQRQKPVLLLSLSFCLTELRGPGHTACPPGPVIKLVFQNFLMVVAEVHPAITVRIRRAGPATTLAPSGEMFVANCRK